MSFDWSEYLNLARELAAQPTAPAGREARLRSAISRAYYAAYCLARNQLRKEGQWSPPPKQSLHRYAIDQFKNSPDQTRCELGHHLNRLLTDRIRADYYDSFPPLDRNAPLDLLLTQQVLSALAKL